MTIRPFQDAKAQLVQTFGDQDSFVYSVAFSPNGQYAISANRDRTIKFWDVTTGRKMRTLSGHDHSVEAVAFSPGGNHVLSGSNDNTLKLWEVNTGRAIHTMSGHRKGVNGVAFAPDGEYVLSGSSDNTVMLWKVATGREAHTFRGHNYSVNSVAFSPDGRYALSGSVDKTIKLWNVATGRPIRTFRGHKKSVESVAFSSDGKYILSGSRDRTMKLWEMETGKELRTFRGHKHSVESVAFSRGGQYALSGSYDQSVKLWEVSTGQELRTYNGHQSRVTSVAFSPDGQHALSGSYDQTMKLWKVSHKALVTQKVEQRVRNWQKKGKYETTEAYRKRVTEEKRNKLIKNYSTQLVDSLGRAQFRSEIAQTNYDADNQTFKIIFDNQSSIYVEVPVTEAPAFDKNLTQIQFSDLNFSLTHDNQFVLRKAKVHNPTNSKTYQYDSGREVAFNTTKLAANFDPINVNVETDNTAPNVRTSTKQIQVGQADVDMNVPKTKMVNTDAIAVIIGNRRYQGDTPNVDYAVNDARVMREYLVKTMGFKPANILYEENASKTRMEVLLGDDRSAGRLANLVKDGQSDVFFYYSGHGAPDPNTESGYLMPVNADPLSLSISGYPLDVLYDNLGNLDAQSITVVIDACFSGATGDGEMLVQNASPIGIKVKNPAAKLDKGFVVTASSGSQVASWYPEKGHGLLTYFWLKGLQGSADRNSDDQVTSTEIKQYLTNSTDGLPYWARRLYNRQQMPQVYGADKQQILVSYK